jgi:hypothetical protein
MCIEMIKYQSNEYPQIKIYGEMDYFTGMNSAQSVFFVQDSKNDSVLYYNQYPNINSVAKGEGCTLIDKVNWMVDNYYNDEMYIHYLQSMYLYGLLRYILWKRISGNFDIDILLRKNSRKFFQSLANSKYASFIEAFNSPELKGYDKAYIRDYSNNI